MHKLKSLYANLFKTMIKNKQHKKVVLYFGSFNPVHIGHMAIANYVVEFTDAYQLWFVLSPQNPLKPRKALLPDYQRLDLLHLAIDDSTLFKASSIEFSMPKPSYTIDTLTWLSEKHPDLEFVLLIGADNLKSFHKWKNFQAILNNYTLFIYPRPGIAKESYGLIGDIKYLDAPLMDISSSFIRKAIKARKNVDFFMPSAVAKYVNEMHFYE